MLFCGHWNLGRKRNRLPFLLSSVWNSTAPQEYFCGSTNDQMKHQRSCPQQKWLIKSDHTKSWISLQCLFLNKSFSVIEAEHLTHWIKHMNYFSNSQKFSVLMLINVNHYLGWRLEYWRSCRIKARFNLRVNSPLENIYLQWQLNSTKTKWKWILWCKTERWWTSN